MAQAAQMTDAEIPMIEEQVETGLRQLLENYKTNYVPGGEVKDDLMSRFTLYPTRPLPEFDHAYAKAFEAHDNFNDHRLVYAMVCDNNMPTRDKAITDLTAFSAPYLAALLGAGTVKCSHLGESRTVLFIERPTGSRLSSLVEKQTRLHEHRIIDNVLGPAIRALAAMAEKKVSHGHIYPHNFFIGDNPTLGECISAPCGSQSPFHYEPIERLLADPLGRGEANEKSDVYSLAILAYELMFGLDKIKALPRDTFIERLLANGSYQLFSNNRDFSDTFQDFFRGALNDNPAERWGIDQLVQWVNGKRFNMIAPMAPKEGARPLLFANEEFYSRPILAHAFHTHWREALKEAKNLKLDRWCETSLHRPELGEKIDRAMKYAGHGSTDAQLNDMLTRVIAILDPTGPLRSQFLSLRPDAIGQMLANVMQHGGPEQNQLFGFIENDFGNFWAEQIESNKTPEISSAVWRLQKVRPLLKSKAIGFGPERVLYDLNPSLCCQSPLLKQYHVTTALDALKALDALAASLGPDTNFADRHLAAFITSKIDLNKEVRIHDLNTIPALANSQELVVMRILAKAQQKHPKVALVGLCGLVGMRIERMIDEIHNRVIRKRLKLQLKKLANGGNVYDVLTAVLNADVSFHDHDGFTKAIALHQINYDRIERLSNPAILEYKSKRAGGKIAMIISYTVLTITSYITLTDILGI